MTTIASKEDIAEPVRQVWWFQPGTSELWPAARLCEHGVAGAQRAHRGRLVCDAAPGPRGRGQYFQRTLETIRPTELKIFTLWMYILAGQKGLQGNVKLFSGTVTVLVMVLVFCNTRV